MNLPSPQEVTTDGALFDLLQTLFGLGNWDPDGEEPWWKHRQLEVTKIKRSRTARRVELDSLALAAYYAKATGEDVRAVTWLYKLIPAAHRWENARRRAAALGELDELISSAMEVEQDSAWITRLARARGPYRKDVYDSWIAHRDLLPLSPSDHPDNGCPTASSA